VERDLVLSNFLKGLRVVINNAFAYPKEHPYFIESVEAFRQKIIDAFVFLSPIKISFSPHSVFFDQRYWEKAAFYVELAEIFHLRKIKSVEFKEGLTSEELIAFLKIASLSTREIFKSGGIGGILSQQKNTHIIVEELDYSELLQGVGQSNSDVWEYLFRQAADKQLPEQLNALADNFSGIAGNFKEKDLLGNEPLRQGIADFFSQLKGLKREKFTSCCRDVFASALGMPGVLLEDNFKKLQTLFKDLTEEEFASLLWKELSTDDKFDVSGFRLFALLSGKEREDKIVSSLLGASEKLPLQNNPQGLKKIRDLLLHSEAQVIPESYRNTISALVKDVSFQEKFSFDRQALQVNYRFILLNLLAIEFNIEKLALILTRIQPELEIVVKEQDLKFLLCLFEVTLERMQDASVADIFEGLSISMHKLTEELIWQGNINPELERLISLLSEPSHSVSFYLEKIFQAGNTQPQILKLFFKFFPLEMPAFYAGLQDKAGDPEFLFKAIASLREIDSLLSLGVLKYIFKISSFFIKIEVLKVMAQMAYFDQGFLITVLKLGELPLKKEAFIILQARPEAKEQALDLLLAIGSPWGRKNKILLENMLIINELREQGAAAHLLALTKRPFFWNRQVRKKALEILGDFRAQKN